MPEHVQSLIFAVFEAPKVAVSSLSLLHQTGVANPVTDTFGEAIYGTVHKSTTSTVDPDNGWVELIIPNGTLPDSFTAGISPIDSQSFPLAHHESGFPARHGQSATPPTLLRLNGQRVHPRQRLLDGRTDHLLSETS